MAAPTLSIIVPIYKVEAYLKACIDSILAQTFRDFELLLVDDGSPDGCPALCDQAAEKDPRVRVIHQKNGGLSAARNAGLDIARGYDCLKVKVGKEPEKDIARLSAIRGAVPKETCSRIDANQGWTPKEAVRILNGMQEKGLDLELVEQPVKAHDFEGLKYVTERSYVPVLADESVFSPADALRIMQTGAADFVNIKLMKCGGITNALRIAAAAEVYGVQCMIGCMLEAKVSVNAAVELACAKKIITKIDLDGPVLCSEDHILGGAVFNEKNITVSDAPGMGIEGFVPGKVNYLA